MYRQKNLDLFTIGCFAMHMKSLLFMSGLFYLPLVDTALIAIALCCFVVSILLQRYGIKTLLLYALITLISLISSVISGQYAVLISVVCILALRNKPFDDFIRHLQVWQGAFILVQIFAAVVWSVINPEYQLYMNIMGVKRFHFGFSHPNVFAVTVVGYVLLWVWNRFDKMNAAALVGILLITITTYAFTRSRTLLISLLMLVVLLAFRQRRGLSKCLIGAAMLAVPVLSILMYLAISTYEGGNPFLIMLDDLFSGRIRLGGYGFERSGVTLLGQNVPYLQGIVTWDSFWRINQFTFDNVYSYCIIQCGIIWLIGISYCFLKLTKFKDYKIAVYIVIWAVYGLTEVHGLNGFVSMPVFMSALLFKN